MTALAALSLAAASAASLTLPAHPSGKGREPTAAQAIVFGKPAQIHSGLVWYDGYGDVSLLLSPKPASCATLASRRAGTYVTAWIHSSSAALRVGRPVTGTGTVRLVVSFASAPRSVTVAHGVSLVVTRLDTRTRGVWHGRLEVARTSVAGKRFGFAGTFAASWCGRR